MVPEPYFRDAAGREWCQVSGPEGVYQLTIGTSSVQWTPPEGYTVDVPVIMQLAFLQSVLASDSVPRHATGAENCGVPQLSFFWEVRNAWFDSGYTFCSKSGFLKNSRFFYVIG